MKTLSSAATSDGREPLAFSARAPHGIEFGAIDYTVTVGIHPSEVLVNVWVRAHFFALNPAVAIRVELLESFIVGRKDWRVTTGSADVHHFAAEHRDPFWRISDAADPPETLAGLQRVRLERVRTEDEDLRLSARRREDRRCRVPFDRARAVDLPSHFAITRIDSHDKRIGPLLANHHEGF
jgi:hypothetical protein